MRNVKAILGATAAATASALFVAAPATAEPVVSDPIAENLLTPLQLDATGSGVYVAQFFGAPVVRIKPNGDVVDFIEDAGQITAVAKRGQQAAYTFLGGSEDAPVTKLKVRKSNGRLMTLANLGRFERRENPDADNRYGVRGVGERCEARIATEDQPRGGIIDSNPYSVSAGPRGSWYVADAAANTLLQVRRNGDVRVVTVLRPVRQTISAPLKSALDLPRCTLGATYAFEPVPTDVQQADSGWLYTSLLPGGPEDPSLGARGRLVRVNPDSGLQRTIAKGFVAATNVAVAPRGRVFVSELFGGKVSVVDLRSRTKRTYVELPTPGGLDWHDGALYVGNTMFDQEFNPLPAVVNTVTDGSVLR